MKYYVIILVLAFVQITCSQNYELIYKADLKPYKGASDSKNNLSAAQQAFINQINKKNALMSDALKIKVIANPQENSYQLRFNSLMPIDGLTQNDLMFAMKDISAFAKIDYHNSTAYGYSIILDSLVVASKSQAYFDWEITKDQKIILGKMCYKARPKLKKGLGRSITNGYIPEEVWFAPVLNFRASPAVFADLPGAILEYKTSRATIRAISVKEVTKNLEFEPLDTYKIVNYKQFKKLMKAHYKKIKSKIKR